MLASEVADADQFYADRGVALLSVELSGTVSCAAAVASPAVLAVDCAPDTSTDGFLVAGSVVMLSIGIICVVATVLWCALCREPTGSDRCEELEQQLADKDRALQAAIARYRKHMDNCRRVLYTEKFDWFWSKNIVARKPHEVAEAQENLGREVEAARGGTEPILHLRNELRDHHGDVKFHSTHCGNEDCPDRNCRMINSTAAFDEDLGAATKLVAKKKIYDKKDKCDLVACMMYTREEIYKPFNADVREADANSTALEEKWKCMFYHASHGVMHLQGAKTQQLLYRGQTDLFGDETAIKDWDGVSTPRPTFTWAAFASTSTQRSVVEHENFSGGGKGVIFEIENKHFHNLGAKLRDLSHLPDEEEVLLPAGTSFEATRKSNEGGRTVVGLLFLGIKVVEMRSEKNGGGLLTDEKYRKYKSKYKDKCADYDLLHQRAVWLEDDVDRLEDEVSRLRRRNEELEEENAELRQQTGRCERCEQVQDEVNHLRRKNRELEEENAELRAEIERLSAQHSSPRRQPSSPVRPRSPARALSPGGTRQTLYETPASWLPPRV